MGKQRYWSNILWIVAIGAALLSTAMKTVQATEPTAAPTPTGGYLSAWGGMVSGALGSGYPPCCPIRPFPVPVADLRHVIAIAAGQDYSLAVRRDGTVWAWGSNRRNEFGTTGGGIVYRPKQVPGITDAVAVAAAAENSIALRRDGSVWQWGNGTDGTVHPPAPISGLTHIRQIAAYAYYHLALAEDGTVWAWGDLGTTQIPNALQPIQVAGLNDIARVAVGLNHALALTQSGTVLAWGANYSGQLGHPGTRVTAVPVAVLNADGTAPLNDVTEVAAGVGHSVALRRDGSVWTWGGRPGSTAGGSLPGLVAGLSGVTAVVAGDSHTLALRRDGSVFGWGLNDVGQVGTGARNLEGCSCVRAPTRVRGLSDVTLLSTSTDNSLAVSRSPAPAHRAAAPRVCARSTGNPGGNGVVLTGAHLQSLAVDTRTGNVFVLAPGGYDFHTGDHVCATGVVTLAGRSARLLRLTPIGGGTDVAANQALAADGRNGRVLATDSGDVQVPVVGGAAALLGTGGRYLRPLKVGGHPGIVAFDSAANRGYVTAMPDLHSSENTISVLDATSGALLHTVPDDGTQQILVDERSGRVFLISDFRVRTLEAGSGREIDSIRLPPGQFAGAGVDERTQRVFVAEWGAAPHEQTPPPSTISIIDARSGAVVKTLSTATSRFAVSTVVVDAPAGVVLASSGGGGTVIDARTGNIRRSISLRGGGITNATGVDPGNGHIFGYGIGAIVEIDPRGWRIVRRIPDSTFAGRSLTVDSPAGRVYSLEIVRGHDQVRAFCLRASCR